MGEAQGILGAWREHLVSDQQVIEWADRVIEVTRAEDIPEWLLDLSTFGPARCAARPSSDFIEIGSLPFSRSFALRAHLLNPNRTVQVARFVEWLSSAVIGEDLGDPLVRFGYEVEHLYSDMNGLDMACELVRKELPRVLELVAPVSNTLLELARENVE